MPFVQVSLLRGKSPQAFDAIVESIHEALVDEFNIPESDKFHVVHEVDSKHLIYPPSYLQTS